MEEEESGKLMPDFTEMVEYIHEKVMCDLLFWKEIHHIATYHLYKGSCFWWIEDV